MSDEDVESFAAFLLDQKAELATRKIWDKTFFKYVDFWGFKSYLLKNNMQKVSGFQKLPDETVSRMLGKFANKNSTSYLSDNFNPYEESDQLVVD